MNQLPAFIRQHIAALRAVLIFTVALGIVYPAVMAGIGQLAFRNQANGSMVSYNGKVAGSSLLCQEFTDAKGSPLPQYFQERASNAANSADKTDYGCDPGFSAASNLGPNSPALLQDVQQRRAAIATFNGVAPSQVPPDAVTASGSGLDPDISPQYADIQVKRVAAARDLPAATVQGLVGKYTQGRTIGFLGEPRVDVLDLNIALDELSAK
ncbi:MAG TPA: potassium-transporting ATPase subunit KdpC [Trebonia sp.]|jgi:K+-transporting ATPase ATPase C chain|nr:potassium-transporting ATPase subunit KdpC [Trebonia sp.]